MSQDPVSSPDENPFSMSEHRLNIVQGYYELGMLEDARNELEEIEREFALTAPVVQMRVLLLLRDEQWEDAFELTSQLREMSPDMVGGYIHGAFCLHEMKRTEEALRMLLSAPDVIKKEAIFYYNLGCYQAAVGDVDDARECLHKSFNLDKGLVEVARKDPDLAVLKDSLLEP